MPIKSAVAILALIALAGCHFGQLPDPNAKAAKTSKYDGKALQANVLQVNKMLTDRQVRGEIDGVAKRQILHRYIREQLQGVDKSKIPADQAWRFGDVYRQLDDWRSTNELYMEAVKVATENKDEDRRVNDSLRLAESMAHLGDVEGGIKEVRSTFDAAPTGKAPILMATLYEFAPAALGQGRDLDIARLLEDAIDQHMHTIVDPETEAGKDFMRARHYHVRRAWEAVIRIYRMQGTDEQLRSAIEQSDEMLRKFVSV
ncbi:MAG TPA: hypothetical protein VNI20_03565 [Fimbriimonadaceae bacterium]|nr:hypothetical protein [Fimbriimonadaceae bacterium]